MNYDVNNKAKNANQNKSRHCNEYGGSAAKQSFRFNQHKLPVFQYKEDILRSIKAHPVTLIVGETGSGKTTQIPQYLLEWDWITPCRRIVCTQPRTIAATSVAQRVSEELQCELGSTVGFHIRLDRAVTAGVTRLEYMTEGVLLRKAMNSQLVSGYGVVIIDEAHERTVNADLLMGFLKERVCRPGLSALDRDPQSVGLRLVVMSATLDTRRLSRYFEGPPVISIPGSLHPIEHRWLSSAADDYTALAMDVVISIHCSISAVAPAPAADPAVGTVDGVGSGCGHQQAQQRRPDGHILVFLCGQQEIENVVRSLSACRCLNPYYRFPLRVHPLYSSLNGKDRQRAFLEPTDPMTRKCVVATNIAETSLTISNVVYVVDCGLSKQKVYSPSDGVEALGIRGISKASVKQRVGRAGRVRPGTAYHLYTRSGYSHFPNETKPEMLRSGLVSETLSMLALGISNPLQFDFIDAPDEMTMARAIHVLYHLGAVDGDGRITATGRRMAKFPVSPPMAKCLLMADRHHCVYEMVVIAAMLENVEKLWRRPRDDQKSDFRLKKKAFYHVSGDHLTLLNVYNAYKQKKGGNRTEMRRFCKSQYWDYGALDRADQIKSQLEFVLTQTKLAQHGHGHNGHRQCKQPLFTLRDHRDSAYYHDIVKCLLAGYFMNVAVQGLAQKYWTFRVLTLDEATDGSKTKAVHIIDKASCHPTSVFYKGNGRNWLIYHQIQPSHTTQLRTLTAIQPAWLTQC